MKTFKKNLLLLFIPFFLTFSITAYGEEDLGTVYPLQDENIVPFEVLYGTPRDCTSLNLREQPTTVSNILCSIPFGDYFEVYDQVGSWFKVQYGDISGYVSWRYFSFIEEPIVEYSNLIGNSIIHYKSSEKRDINMAVACSTINGITLNPGEEFRWSKIIGQTTTEKGYLEATVIINEQPVLGLGGGVCQVSTTIYNSLFDTSMLVTERHKHSIGSSYSKNDATVAHGYKDFAFINTYNFPICIESYSYKGIVFVNLYKVEEILKTE